MRERIVNALSALSVVLALLSLFVAYRHTSRAAPESHLDFVFGEVRFKQTPFGDALQMMRDRAGVNIAVDWKVMNESGVTESSPVNLELKNVPVLGVLEAMLDQFQPQYRIGYHLDRDVIVIDNGYSWPHADPPIESHVYPIQDLLDLPGAKDAAPIDDGIRDERARLLMRMIYNSERSDNPSLAAWAGRLFVMGTPGQHLIVRKVLEGFRSDANRMGHWPLDSRTEAQ